MLIIFKNNSHSVTTGLFINSNEESRADWRLYCTALVSCACVSSAFVSINSVTGFCRRPLAYSHSHSVKSLQKSSTDITPYLISYEKRRKRERWALKVVSVPFYDLKTRHHYNGFTKLAQTTWPIQCVHQS